MKKRMEFLYRGVALLLAALLMLSDLTVIASAVVEGTESQQIEQVEQQVEETEQVEVTVCDVCGMEECVCEAEDEVVEEPQEDVLDEEVQEEPALLPELMMAVPFADTTVSIEWNGSRIVAKSAAETVTSYQWMSADTEESEFTTIADQTNFYYDITAADEGKFIKAVVDGVETEAVGPIGKLVEFYIDKGSVTLGATYSGKDSDGNAVSDSHAAGNIYVVKQSNASTFTTNRIEFSGHHPYAPFDVTLDGVNMYESPKNHSQAPGASGASTPSGGNISITATASAEKHVTLRLKGENQVRNITYYNGGDRKSPTSVTSSLKITDINGDGATDGGSLYMPKKVAANDIDAFVATSTNYNHWNAVIGGTDGNSLVQNLHIAGGTLQVLSTLGDNCTAIGAGGNGYCQIKISGGTITAHCNGTGTAIGGGIGWNAAGGPANIEITGGTIYAKNHGNITSGTDLVGGVAIGAGSSFHEAGSYSTVTITGGTVEAYGTFGNGLGGGNSSTSTGGSATIAISDATVTASSIGGGNSKSGAGGQATVTIDELIDDSTTVTLTKGIGGGDSASGNGGKATITVNGGTMTANGTIGGGDGGGTTGVGGEAEVTVKGGTLKAAAIGGGTGSGSGAGGKATVTVEEGNGTLEAATIGGGAGGGDTGVGGEAEVIVKGGTLKAAAIGGGTGSGSGAGGQATVTVEEGNGTLEAATIGGGTGGDTGNGGAAVIAIHGGTVRAGSIGGGRGRNGASDGVLGYATADITGGDISGQFLLQAAGDASCYFRMSGGTLHGVDTAKTEPYDYVQNDGAAVYMNDPKGEVTISGGTIKDCSAAKGGAIYMSAGTCTISNTATISNCSATESGGAIYLAGGKVTMEGGTLGGETVEEANTATVHGGAIYLEKGTVSISGGTVSKNSASQNGGAIYLANGEVTVSGGTIKNNSAANDGGAVYVGSGSFTMSNGMLIGNSATANGGAAYVAGNFTMTNGTIGGTEDGTANTAGKDGGAVYVNNGNFTMSAGTVSGNTAEQNGGGIAVNNGKIIMSGGAVSGNEAKTGDGGGMYVSSVGDSEVAVRIYSGKVLDNTAAISGGAVAVEGGESSKITVHVGVDALHYNKDGELKLGFQHEEEDGTYTHNACPVIGGNTSQKNGGAFYITGGAETHLDMYCLTDSGGNKTHGDDDVLDQSMSDFLMVEGGKVYITTSEELVDEDKITPPDDDQHGSTTIKGSIHVISGVLELFGSKTNPKLDGSLTIDLMTEDDRYFDHRAADGIITISYHENFTLDGANAVTQTAFDVKDKDAHIIHPSMYAHEGYTFLGWNSNKNAKKGDSSGHWFEAITSYTFHLTDEEHKIEGTVDGTNVYGDIIIYAIWEPNGYYVEYLPGVPDGEEWYGEIENNGTRYEYATEYTYAENGFVYPGYKFDGWSVPEIGVQKPGETFQNLTSVQGGTVTVTARWVKCEHPDVTYTAEGSTITKTCDQCKLTATATLSAEDATYDGNRHEAWLTLSNKTFWNPGEIQYKGVTLAPVDTLSGLIGGQQITGDKLCVNAGDYTATITALDGTSVSVNYKIDKAKQPDPNGRPSYTPPESGNTLLVTKLPIEYRQSPETGVYAKHAVRYYELGVEKTVLLNDPTPEGEAQLQFKLPTALKTYSVMAYYPETENHYASEWVSAETTFTFGENLHLTFVPDAGINIFSAPEKAENEVALQLETRNGYYLVGEKYTFSPKVISGEMSYDTNNLIFSESEGIHYVSVAPDKLPKELTEITVHIGTTKRTPGMSVEVKEKEVFRNFTNTNPVTIAQDSAFTAKCTVTGYDVSVYEEMTLNVPMPEGTSIILRDLGDGSYWYYTAKSNLTSVSLGSFMRMGKPEEKYTRSGDLMLLFVVDYADAATKPNIEKVTLSLSAGTKTDAVGIMAMPTVGKEVTLAEVSLALSSAAESAMGLTQMVTVKADNTVAASRYDHRDVALVLSPSSAATTVVEVPIDASVQATIKGKNATWRPNENGNIVIPLGDFTALSSSESVTLELSSDMFPVGVKQYMLSAQLYLSATDADTAPINGVPMGSAVNLTFTSQRDETGIKICVANDQRLFTIGSSITAQVEQSSKLSQMTYNVNVELHWEIDNGFANTAIAPTKGETNNTYVFDLSKAQRGGNYCIVATLVADTGYVLNEARYYFILQEASEEDPTQGPSQGTNQEGSDSTETEQGTTENP